MYATNTDAWAPKSPCSATRSHHNKRLAHRNERVALSSPPAPLTPPQLDPGAAVNTQCSQKNKKGVTVVCPAQGCYEGTKRSNLDITKLWSVRTTNPHDDSVRKGPPLRPPGRQGKFHTARKGPSEDSAQGAFCLEPRLSEPLQERKHGLGGHVHRSDRQRATTDFQLRNCPPAEPSAPRPAPSMQWTSRLTGWWSAAGSACYRPVKAPLSGRGLHGAPWPQGL